MPRYKRQWLPNVLDGCVSKFKHILPDKAISVICMQQ